jgi:hypothetical protein
MGANISQIKTLIAICAGNPAQDNRRVHCRPGQHTTCAVEAGKDERAGDARDNVLQPTWAREENQFNIVFTFNKLLRVMRHVLICEKFAYNWRRKLRNVPCRPGRKCRRENGNNGV